MPTKEAAELQHSREFVEEQDAAVMRQTPVAKGDFHISRRSTHPDLNLTKSDVKVTMKICSGSPARSVRNSHPMPFFTPDSGPTGLAAIALAAVTTSTYSKKSVASRIKAPAHAKTF